MATTKHDWRLPSWLHLQVGTMVALYGGLGGLAATIVLAMTIHTENSPLQLWYIAASVTAGAVIAGAVMNYFEMYFIVGSPRVSSADQDWTGTGAEIVTLTPVGGEPRVDPITGAVTDIDGRALVRMEELDVGGFRSWFADVGRGSAGGLVGEGPLGWAAGSGGKHKKSGQGFQSPYQFIQIRHAEIGPKWLELLRAREDYFWDEDEDGSGGWPIYRKVGINPNFLEFLRKAADIQAEFVDILGVKRISEAIWGAWAPCLGDDPPDGGRIRELLEGKVESPEVNALLVKALMDRFDTSALVSAAFYGITSTRPARMNTAEMALQIRDLNATIARLTANVKDLEAENRVLHRSSRREAERYDEAWGRSEGESDAYSRGQAKEPTRSRY